MLRILMAILIFTPLFASAHDWYSGLQNEIGETCCGGSDCAAISDEDVTPVPGGYDVHVPKFMGYPFRAFVPNSRAKPAKEGGEYHLCVVAGQARCFFFPAPTY